MRRFFISLVAGLVLGVGVGLILGWVVFPVQYVNSPATALDQRYSDDYTVMIALAHLDDADVSGALERLRLLQVDNVPAHVQAVTERYITASRDIDEVRALVTLSEALGRLTPIMEPYRPLSAPEVSQ